MLRTRIFLLATMVCLIGCQPASLQWRPVNPPNSPPPTNHGAIAYMRSSQSAILFGGQINDRWSDETWLWSGSDWTKLIPEEHPSAREKLAMAYDESSNRIILFGGTISGTLFADTWEWDGNNWHLMHPSHTPPARCCHTMAYDQAEQKVIMYGGWDSVKKTFLSDTWEWDGSDWQEVTCCNIPVDAAHKMVATPNGIVAMLTSGFGTWVWNSGQWKSLSASNPPDRADAGLAYDEQHNHVILFGGTRNSQLINDTWVFDAGNWIELALQLRPPARYGHVMFYDSKRQSIMIFGGVTANGQRTNDMWELNLPQNLTGFAVTPRAQTTP